MNEYDKIIVIIITIIITLVLIIMPGSWIAKSYFEAKTFNKITHSNVTTWDAMWVELRVQEGTGSNDQ